MNPGTVRCLHVNTILRWFVCLTRIEILPEHVGNTRCTSRCLALSSISNNGLLLFASGQRPASSRHWPVQSCAPGHRLSLPRSEERGSISSAALDKPAEGRRMSPGGSSSHIAKHLLVSILKRHGYRGTSTNRGWAANPLSHPVGGWYKRSATLEAGNGWKYGWECNGRARTPRGRTESSLLSDRPRALYPTIVTSWNEEFGVRHNRIIWGRVWSG